MTAGLTSTGFVAKTTEENLAEANAATLSTIDPAIDTAPTEVLGQYHGILSSKFAELWELLATIYNLFNPDAAEGTALENIAALSGVTRLPKTRTLVYCTLNLAASQSFAPGALVAHVAGQPTVLFTNRDQVTSVLAGNYTNVPFVAIDYGPISVNASTLTAIPTSTPGWNSITNPANGITGRNVETDTELRVRRELELTAPGACTVDSIRADLLDQDKVPGVIQALVFENTSLLVDGNGLPGKSIECVIWDGSVPAADDAKVRATIWASKPSGIETYGSISGTTPDSTGTSQTVKFSRATARRLYLDSTITTNSLFDATNGPAAVRSAMKAVVDKFQLGDDVIALALSAAALTVTGVVDVTSLKLGFSASPVGTANLVVGAREIATLSTSDVLVNGA